MTLPLSVAVMKYVAYGGWYSNSEGCSFYSRAGEAFVESDVVGKEYGGYFRESLIEKFGRYGKYGIGDDTPLRAIQLYQTCYQSFPYIGKALQLLPKELRQIIYEKYRHIVPRCCWIRKYMGGN